MPVVMLWSWCVCDHHGIPHLERLLQLLGDGARLRRVSLAPGGQVGQLSHQLLHLLALPQQLVPLRPLQHVGQATALGDQAANGSLACGRENERERCKVCVRDKVERQWSAITVLFNALHSWTLSVTRPGIATWPKVKT